jgi:hypothetical protein
MALRSGQFNFSKGEIADELVARVDVPAYTTALKRARNVVILKYGGVTKRPGTRLVAEVYDSTNAVRVVPFQFSLSQTYALELGQGYMRPLALGGYVLEDKLTVQAVTTGTTTLIQQDFHAYSVGDQIYFFGVLGATWLNGKVGRILTVPDANHFTIDINSVGLAALTGDTGGITRVGTPPAPPTPPVVPAPVDPPTPPDVGGGGGARIFGGSGGTALQIDYR